MRVCVFMCVCWVKLIYIYIYITLFVLCPTTGQVWYKAFLKWVWTQGCSPHASGKIQKYLRFRRHSPSDARKQNSKQLVKLYIYTYNPGETVTYSEIFTRIIHLKCFNLESKAIYSAICN